ncbi:MAG: GNAT family N-acetyltransferase [Actinomycetes bacterium]
MPSEIKVSAIVEITVEVEQAFARLVPQLSRSNPPPTAADLDAIASSDASTLLVARDPDRGGEIVGTLTLVIFRIPTGIRAWIEDVVVDESARGRGVGEALNREAIQRAQEAGARTVDLTSRPNREAANRLYRRLGFGARETNVYRYKLDS